MTTVPVRGTPCLSPLRPTARPSVRRRLFTACATLGLATALSRPTLHRLQRRSRHRKEQHAGRARRQRNFLPPFLVDAIVGAIGEIGQLAVLYPLDTIKVRCQAQGVSTRTVWAGVRSQGFNLANIASLFAGCAPSAVCAALIGSCYLASFCAAKRVLARASVASNHSSRSALLDTVLSGPIPECSGEKVGEADPAAREHKEAGGSGRTLEEGQAAASAASDTAAALIASLLTSVLEAPVELFRHRMQAGLSQGRMLTNMATAFGGEGLSSLYWGYAPFLLKGIPYDVAELFSYSQLSRNHNRLPLLSSLPVACRDCFTGAMAGAAAVLFSMPADCIKTRMELGATRPPPGLLRGSAAFFRTGRSMLAEKGFRCMFVGVAPRLMENVPSTMFYWVLVAALRRMLEPFTYDSRESLSVTAS